MKPESKVPASSDKPELVASAAPLLEELAERSKQQQGQSPALAKPVSDSIRSAALAGWIIIALFFGGFGAWAFTAPLHGAVVANGVVRVESNRKSVQHLDGGIVKELRIKEGAMVRAGDVLIVLDDNQARAEHEVLSQQYVLLRLTDERLRTEFIRGEKLVLPAEFKDSADNPDVKSMWAGQISQFESRAAAIDGQRRVIQEKIAQLESQIQGFEAQLKSHSAQLESVRQELESLLPLLEKNLISRPRYLQLERSGMALDGQAADTRANIAKSRQAIAEQLQQIAQLDNDRMNEITKELRDTQAKLLEVIPRRANARAVLSRVVIRSPYNGRVVGLNVFSIGGVINRGEKILDIVPEEDALIIEAQIPVEEISEVRPQMRADVHLTAFKQRITPVVRGEVTNVSADRLTDQKANTSYYTALIRVEEDELSLIPNAKLYPGMPATVMIQTIERTAADYILGPLTMSFNKAFRQR